MTLTPRDILILAQHIMLRPAKFVAEYTVPAIHQGSGLPGAKLSYCGLLSCRSVKEALASPAMTS